MKYSLSLFFLCAILAMFSSCRKTLGSRTVSDNLSGRWQIVTDSTTTGVGAANHWVVYEGRKDDYYDFGSDSVLTVKEADSITTYEYLMTSDTSFALYTPDDHFHTWPIAYSIIDPTTRSVSLLNAWQTTPGGILGRAVYLKR